MQSAMDLPFATVQVIQALILICVVGGEFLKRYRVRILLGGVKV